jgi:hypothetical protein
LFAFILVFVFLFLDNVGEVGMRRVASMEEGIVAGRSWRFSRLLLVCADVFDFDLKG